MLTAALFHGLAGFLFGGLGLKVVVLIVYAMGNIAVGLAAMVTANLTLLGALGHLALAMTCSSVGYFAGGWLSVLLEDDRDESQRDDRSSRTKPSLP